MILSKIRFGLRAHRRWHESRFEGRAGDFAPHCLNCGNGQMEAAIGCFVCRSCGSVSGVQ